MFVSMSPTWRTYLACITLNHMFVFLLAILLHSWSTSTFQYANNFMLGSMASLAPQPSPRPPQPTIGKVSMVYGGHSVYERALASHEEHNRRLNYPIVILRKPILDGIWNKLFFLISTRCLFDLDPYISATEQGGPHRLR